MNDIYHNPNSAKQVANVAMFRRIQERFPWLTFTQPNPVRAPWHYQAVVRWEDRPEGVLMNFWPHTGKAQIDGEKPVHGESAIRGLIARAIDESQDNESLDVIE